ncbi:hypothetical protein B566_EDAN002957 [Ephemera danica]|nr:hypothetical protein B566_EDAN002957 [Ephemera danica]
MQNLIASAKLLGLREQGAGCEAEEVPATAPPSHELTREPRDCPDLLVLPAPLQVNAQPQPENEEAIRRRTFGGEAAVTLHSSDARLSLPSPAAAVTELGATSSGDASDPRQDTPTTECVTMPGYGQALQPPISWPQHTPAWAITPFRDPLPPNFVSSIVLQPPPPPPPKPSPSCEQVTTVRRASSVLPDGTTRRSVTFHADSIIYAPPTANALQVTAGGACSAPHSEGEDDEETTLVVRGLERVPGLGPRELIDALEQRLGVGELGQAVRAVCLHHQTVAATVSIGNRDMAMRLLTGGLEARGEPLVLEQEDQVISRLAADPSHVLLVSGVAHQVSDAAVRAAVARACGLRVNQVCRHVYKGVDTGERLVRVVPGSPTPPLLQVSQAANLAEGESKFRTHLSVQLRRPGESPSAAAPAAAAAVVQEQPRTAQPAGANPTQTSGQCTAPPSPQCNGPVSPPPYTPPPAVPLRRPSTVVQQQQCIEPHRESAATDCPVQEVKQPAAGRKKASQNGGILRQDAARRVAKSRSVSVESSARAPPQRRRLGVVERPSSEELQLPDEPISSGPALPWCACWGNGCI